MISPQKQLFDYFFKLISGKDIPTYDYLPLEDEQVIYPFVVLSYTHTVPSNTKYSRNDSVFLTIDVWGNKQQRKAVGEIADGILNEAIGYIKTSTYNFSGLSSQQSLEMTIDTSVPNTVFQRGNLQLELSVI